MEPEVVAALVGGVFTVIGTVATSIYQIRASRAKQASGQDSIQPVEPEPMLPVDNGDVPPALPAPSPFPKDPIPPNPEPAEQKKKNFVGALRIPTAPTPVDGADYEIVENDPSDPFYKTLPKPRARNAYPRLRGKELDSQFLTDYTMNYRNGDRIEFSDGSEA
ncbi:hypothetical protein ABZV14_07840 [Streptosporangium canum]|uniref:hypothetical protein n=1 Tax=Streptosporangium canum TaxID=324952 RepID=UPI0033BC8F50